MRHLLILTAMLGAAACTGAPAEAPPVATDSPAVVEDTPAVPPQVVKAAKIAKAVRANPADAAAVLEANGMTSADLDALMYEIASDPVLSEAYANATAP